jgi:hypothetical protein
MSLPRGVRTCSTRTTNPVFRSAHMIWHLSLRIPGQSVHRLRANASTHSDPILSPWICFPLDLSPKTRDASSLIMHGNRPP